jgi:CHAP domain
MPTVNELLTVAWNQVGYAEGKNNDNKYGEAVGQNHVPWCGHFVNWVAKRANVRIPNCAYTPAGAAAFKSMRSWHTKGEPQAGDIIFFDFPNDDVERISHVGIVVKALWNGNILTIEGNTTCPGEKGDERNGGGVTVKERELSTIVGWGRPRFRPAFHPIAGVIVQAHKNDEIPKCERPAPKLPPRKTTTKPKVK